jgi:ferritin-like metal-binding protein YciE
MPTKDLRELYIDELKDLYNAESQLVKALPKNGQSRFVSQATSRF